jgi:lysophospholipase
LFSDVADAPPGGQAYWLRTSDGVRIRMALWPQGSKGTVLLFPGRTEYIEKYGRTVGEFARRGFATAVVDWRGQGLSDRPDYDAMSGHVDEFVDYQNDVAAVVTRLAALGQPGPFYLVSHSMGGCIALRALYGGLAVKAAAFSAPMWGISFAPGVRPVATGLAKVARGLGQGHRYAPGTGPVTYVATAAFKGNVLTRNAESYDWMKAQITAHPELALGGPSLHWLNAAMQECRALMGLPPPDYPIYCALGRNEKLVDPKPIYARMANWPNGDLDLIDTAEHELMMEVPATQQRFFDKATALFEATP